MDIPENNILKERTFEITNENTIKHNSNQTTPAESSSKTNQSSNPKKSNQEKNNNENIVFVGSKPLINYIKSITMQFNKRNAPEVIIKSRGKFISKAVDAAEVAKRMLEKKAVKVKGISISSESFEKDGKTTNISTMDIVLSC